VIWFFAALAALTTFMIAAASIGGVTAVLARRSRRSVYDVGSAVEYVADHLSDELTATVSYDDLRAVLTWYVEYLEDKGVASEATADDPGGGLILVDDDEPLAFIIGRSVDVESGEPGGDLTDEALAAVLVCNLDYEESIGVIGAPVPPPEVD
jgi:hypothetical protein